MTDITGFNDQAIIQRVIDLHAGMRHDPIASRLASIEFGPSGLWDAFRYEFADLLYDHVWGQTHPDLRQCDSDTGEARGIAGRIQDTLWQGTWGQELLSGALERTGGLDFLERLQFVWRSHLNAPVSPAPVALVGFAHRSGVMRFPPFVNETGSQQGSSFRILVHDDNRGRHRRAFRAVKHRLIASESLLRTSDYKRATQRAKEIEAILAPGETRGMQLSEVFQRFKSRCVHRRRFRRLYLGAEAVGRFMASGVVKTFVIPDERQPLARVAALTARTCSSAKIVSVSESVDQFVRKMPYWGDLVSDVVVVGSATAQRSLTRSGISGQRVRVCAFPGLEGLLDAVAPSSGPCEARETRQSTILYCDQGLPGSSRRFTQLADCLGNPPRAKLVFRPHPVQSALLLRLVVTGGQVERSQSIIEAIRSSDVVVTHSSMVATIAGLMERPVILWNPAPSPTMPVLLIERVAYWARTREELATLITLLLRSSPDHPLRENQMTFKRELASSCSEGVSLASLL